MHLITKNVFTSQKALKSLLDFFLSQARIRAQIKNRFPDLNIALNGGIRDTSTALAHLKHVDAVMIGREAYRHPLFLAELSQVLFTREPISARNVMKQYLVYMETELANGTRLHDMTRHCLGLFTGMPGARRYRQTLGDTRRLKTNDLTLVHDALGAMSPRAA